MWRAVMLLEGLEEKENMKDTESIRKDNEAEYEGFSKITTKRRKGLWASWLVMKERTETEG